MASGFTDEEKRAVVARMAVAVADGNETLTAIADELGLSLPSIINWRNKFGSSGEKPTEAVTAGPGGRRHYSAEYKAAAVARVHSGEAFSAVATDLDIGDAMLRRWAAEAKTGKKKSHAGKASKLPAPIGRPKNAVQVISVPSPTATVEPINGNANHVMDAYTWLRHAEKQWENIPLRNLDEPALLSVLALRQLQKVKASK